MPVVPLLFTPAQRGASQASNNAPCCNGQTRRTLTETAWARLSGAMFSCGQPAPFQHTGALCEAETRDTLSFIAFVRDKKE